MTNHTCTCDLPWGSEHHALVVTFTEEGWLATVHLIHGGRLRKLRPSWQFQERLETSTAYSDRLECPFARAKATSSRVMGLRRVA